ncbi:MAG: metallophosphoesterase, partial [Clostridiales bacterium]
ENYIMGLFIVILVITILLYSGINFYIGKRLWDGFVSNLNFVNFKIYWIIFFTIVFSYFIYAIISRLFKDVSILNRVFGFIGSYWMSIMVYSLLILLVIDILRLVNYKLKIIDINEIFTTGNLMIFSGLIIVFILGLMIYGTINAKNISISEYNSIVTQNKSLSQNYNIVVISDIHIGSFISKKQVIESVNIINDLKPDIVIIAGDIVDDNIEPFENLGMDVEFKKIKSKYGVFGVLGNHDNFGKDVNKTIKVFKKSNINMLIDDRTQINNEINIIGRNDTSMTRAENLKRASLDKLTDDIDKSKYTILVDHQPVEIESADKNKVDLMISGHTHAGQFFPIGFITKRIFFNDWGQKRLNNVDVIVSCGLGTWGPPIRIGTKSEIVNIQIINKVTTGQQKK